jgi:hypothetical protein
MKPEDKLPEVTWLELAFSACGVAIAIGLAYLSTH